MIKANNKYQQELLGEKLKIIPFGIEETMQ
jgi:hypothetical protein